MTISAEPRLLFRADGNATIGLGHLVRLLALAEQLRGLAPGLFLVREPTAAVARLLADAGWEVQALPASQPLAAEADWLARHLLRPTDVLILDGYGFDLPYQQRLHSSGCGLVYIDDLLAWPVVADVLINHSPGILPTDYQSTAQTIFLLGPAFSLLRLPFLAAAAAPQPVASLTSALVCFGGADPLRLTERTLRALLAVPQLRRLGVLVGGAFGDGGPLQALAAQHAERKITVHRNLGATELVALLQDYDVAVVPASTVLIEALVLGRPVITGYYADNQHALANYVHAHQQAFSVGNFTDLTDIDLASALRKGLDFHQAQLRQPYVTQLEPTRLRTEVQALLDRYGLHR